MWCSTPTCCSRSGYSRTAASAPLRDRVDAGDWLALTRDDCLAGFPARARLPAFALDAARQAAIHADYAATARCEPAGPASAVAVPRCQDRDDQFLELAAMPAPTGW